MNDNEKFFQLKAKYDAERRDKLQSAKESAQSCGKEPFDLNTMYSMWPDCPDFRYEEAGVSYSKEDRIRDWEEIYYCNYPEIMILEAFVSHMKFLQSHGAFD